MQSHDTAYRNALKKREELKRDLEKVETFLELYAEFSDEPPLPSAAGSSASDSARTIPEHVVRETISRLPEPTAWKVKRVSRQAMLDAGHPLNRADLTEAVEKAGIRIVARDRGNYIGTVIWRAKDEFVNIKGHGYWPADVPNEYLGYPSDESGPADEGDHRASEDASPVDDDNSGADSAENGDLMGLSSLSFGD